MKTFKLYGKYLDQPILVSNFKKSVPYILSGAGVLYTVKETLTSEDKLNTAVRTGLTLAGTIGSALYAPKITNKIFKNSDEFLLNSKQLKKENIGLITNFLNENVLPQEIKDILNKYKGKVFKFKDFKKMVLGLEKTKDGMTFLNKIIPEPENIKASDIFSKIGELSLMGFIPIVGGISGGITGDILTNNNWKDKVANKIKEGSYQYLANIFLCNVGAGVALGIMEKLNIKSKTTRALGMIAGIISTGIVGGSALANYIGQKVINPLVDKGKNENNGRKIYSERVPEPIDIGLHVDDIATVAAMSGLKWIEPALPILYSISGYRSGIGYRNNQSK